MHLGPLFFEKHLALDHFVVCAYAPGFAVGRQRGRVSLVKDEQELVWDFLFDLDHFVVAHKVEFGRLFSGRGGTRGQEAMHFGKQGYLTDLFFLLQRLDASWV